MWLYFALETFYFDSFSVYFSKCYMAPCPGLTQSKCCFVKAALPWILELLTMHFKYTRGSISDSYVQSLRALILNIYSQRCVPQIDEEVEVSGPFWGRDLFQPVAGLMEFIICVLNIKPISTALIPGPNSKKNKRENRFSFCIGWRQHAEMIPV